MLCPGSVNFLDDIDEDGTEGAAPAEGTILHSFCESALVSGNDAYHYVGEVREHDGHRLELDDELADMMQDGLDYLDSLPGKLFVEHRVDLKRWMPGQFGTLDAGIAGKRLITIFDWKWGFLPVSPIRNVQLQIYGLGFWDNIARHITDATTFRLVIWQPRAPGGGGEWDVDLDELLAFGKELKEKAAATYGKSAPRIPGPTQCRFCDGARQMRCKEYVEYNMGLIVEDFDELDADIETGIPLKLRAKGITPERRGYILEHRPMIEKFLDRLHAQALDDALKGQPTPGQKAIYGRRPMRRWKDKAVAEARLTTTMGDDAFSRKIKTPAQVEKELPPKIYAKLAGLIEQGDPKPTLVSVDDARPAIPPITDLFDD